MRVDALVRRVRITIPAARPRAWTPKRMASRCVGGVVMAVLCRDPWGSMGIHGGHVSQIMKNDGKNNEKS